MTEAFPSSQTGDARSPGASPVHISVCICTFKRPGLLAELLRGVLQQTTGSKFFCSIVVVDNDRQGSARETVERFQREHPGVVDYAIEPEQSIALARNRLLYV